jgi:hypothetical protein
MEGFLFSGDMLMNVFHLWIWVSNLHLKSWWPRTCMELNGVSNISFVINQGGICLPLAGASLLVPKDSWLGCIHPFEGRKRWIACGSKVYHASAVA